MTALRMDESSFGDGGFCRVGFTIACGGARFRGALLSLFCMGALLLCLLVSACGAVGDCVSPLVALASRLLLDGGAGAATFLTLMFCGGA